MRIVRIARSTGSVVMRSGAASSRSARNTKFPTWAMLLTLKCASRAFRSPEPSFATFSWVREPIKSATGRWWIGAIWWFSMWNTIQAERIRRCGMHKTKENGSSISPSNKMMNKKSSIACGRCCFGESAMKLSASRACVGSSSSRMKSNPPGVLPSKAPGARIEAFCAA